MLKINKISICSHIEEGQFSKVNIIGLNVTGVIGFDKLPYTFISYIAVQGRADENIKDASLEIVLKDEKGNVVDIFKPDKFGDQAIAKESVVFFVLPFKIPIKNFGEMIINFMANGKKIYSEGYELTQGSSPNIQATKNLPHAKIFDGIGFIKPSLSGRLHPC